ncbi:BCCT family transporter [Deltaproteobacteria bacterium OttesenSCG-928-K17]|nr:BCCT family transporter [Deltaproteobacteria bacterium OttesenSCG-928-K17]
MKGLLTRLFGDYDSKIFYPFLLAAGVMIVFLAFNQAAFTKVVSAMTNYLIFNFAWMFQIGALLAILFCFWLMFSRYGDLKLGKDDDTPEFSDFAWISMMFSAGFGLSLWLWYSSEILYHLFESDRLKAMGLLGQPGGVATALQSVFMDWGLHGWCLFTVGALAVALPAYRKDKPMSLSGGLYGLLGDKSYTSVWGRLTDIFGALGAFGGTAAAMGMGLTVIFYGFNDLTGIEMTLGPKAAIMLFIVVSFICATISGLYKAIKWMSVINTWLTIFLCVFVLVLGPTVYMLTVTTEALGNYITYFIDFSLWGNSGTGVDFETWKATGWQNWWLIFYILWWVSYIPFCAGFFARISRGRTIRGFVAGSIFGPTIITFICFGVWSATSAHMQFTGQIDMYAQLQNDFGGTIYRILHQMPISLLTTTIVLISSYFYGVTTYNSTTYFLSMQFTGGDPNPKTSMRALSGVLIGATGLAFLVIGDFNGLKSLGILAGTPFFIILLAYMLSIIKMLKAIEMKTF